MSSYDTILRWAKEAKVLLRQGNTAAVKNNLAWIIIQCKEDIKKEARKQKALSKAQAKQGEQSEQKTT